MYLLANQLVDKLQSKEEAQDALRDIERFLEGAPSTLNSGTDILTIEYEAVITPQLQVGTNKSVSYYVKQIIQYVSRSTVEVSLPCGKYCPLRFKNNSVVG